MAAKTERERERAVYRHTKKLPPLLTKQALGGRCTCANMATLGFSLRLAGYVLLLAHREKMGYWHQRADEMHGNPPKGILELLVVTDKVGRPQVSMG